MKLVLGLALLFVPGVAAQDKRPRDESADDRKARLEKECKADKHWKLDELDHYFLISDVDDRSVLAELKKRIEGVRALVGPLFTPPPHPKLLDPPCKTTLRVYSHQDAYLAGGGFSGSNGGYFPERTEIMLFLGAQQEGRVELFRMAQSLVVPELLDRQFQTGEHAPWFVHGLQDYFAGFGFRNGKLERKPHAQRLATLREALAADKFVPIADLVLMKRPEFDGENPWHADWKLTWAEAWSFMWFLINAQSPTISCNDVFRRYLDAWKQKPDYSAATRAVFEGVDWDAVQKEWRAFIEAIKE
jgi:hypothetical protein